MEIFYNGEWSTVGFIDNRNCKKDFPRKLTLLVLLVKEIYKKTVSHEARQHVIFLKNQMAISVFKPIKQIGLHSLEFPNGDVLVKKTINNIEESNYIWKKKEIEEFSEKKNLTKRPDKCKIPAMKFWEEIDYLRMVKRYVDEEEMMLLLNIERKELDEMYAEGLPFLQFLDRKIFHIRDLYDWIEKMYNEKNKIFNSKEINFLKK